MSLKAVIEKLDSVPEAVRGEYKEQDGKFYLDIEGMDDHHGVGALKRAKDYEKEEARKWKETAGKLTTDLEASRADLLNLQKNGVPKGDVERLEESYKTQNAQKEAELGKQISSLSASLEKHLLEGQAIRLATELAAKPEYVELLMPHIRSRLQLEANEAGEHHVRVLDKDGKPSALNADDLKKELLGHKAFASILTGSKATGGGATGGGNGGGAPKKLSDMNDAERTTFAKEDPAGFRSALEAARVAAASEY